MPLRPCGPASMLFPVAAVVCCRACSSGARPGPPGSGPLPHMPTEIAARLYRQYQAGHSNALDAQEQARGGGKGARAMRHADPCSCAEPCARACLLPAPSS